LRFATGCGTASARAGVNAVSFSASNGGGSDGAQAGGGSGGEGCIARFGALDGRFATGCGTASGREGGGDGGVGAGAGDGVASARGSGDATTGPAVFSLVTAGSWGLVNRIVRYVIETIWNSRFMI
jgi:hypothetical protein